MLFRLRHVQQCEGFGVKENSSSGNVSIGDVQRDNANFVNEMASYNLMAGKTGNSGWAKKDSETHLPCSLFLMVFRRYQQRIICSNRF